MLDVLVIVVFAAIGRNSHDEGIDPAGIARTSGPFLAGAIVGWAVSGAWRRPVPLRPTGLVVWACALGLGMILRVAFGGGIEPSFIVVAGVFLALFLLGWRLLASRLLPPRR